MPQATSSNVVVSSAQIAPGIIVNSDINASAAIEESKIAFATNDGSRHDHSAADIAVGTLATARGGTGLSSPTAKGLLRAQGASAMDLIAPGAANQILKSDGTDWAAGGAPAGLILVSTADTNHTGNTTETELYSGVLPGGTMGANGILDIWIAWEAANDGGGVGTQTLKIKFGGTLLVSHDRSSITGTTEQISHFQVFNVNSASSQEGHYVHFAQDGAVPTLKATGFTNTAAINTASDVTIQITGTLSNAAHHIKIVRIAIVAYSKS